MARSAVTREKASSEDAKSISRVLLLDTTGSDLSSSPKRFASDYLNIRVAENSPQTCKLLGEASYDLVVAGPQLDKLSLNGIGARSARPQPEMQALLSALTPLYQARDPREFLVRLVAAAALVMDSQQTFALSCDRATGEPEFASLHAHRGCPANLPDIVRRYFGGMGAVQDADERDPATQAAPQLWLVPVTHDSRLQALVGFVSPPQTEPLTGARLEMLRLLSRVSGPFLGLLNDMQTLRRRSEQAEAIVHLKSHFLGNLAHEFRSLLAAVQGYSRRVMEERAGVINDRQRDHLTVVLRNTRKLLDLVSHSLPFVAEQQLRVEPFDLRAIWQGVLKRAQRKMPEKSSRITEQIPAESFMVAADKDRLAAVLEILLANALQCADNQGEVAVQFLRGVHGEVTVRLFASGGGLPPELVDAMFEHQKFASGTADSGKLQVTGLSLVHDMIWLHGGRISVTSNVGEGTVFTFTLPPAVPEENAEA